MRKNILTLIIIALIAPSIHAETMTGGAYTLNGSVDVMTNQGAGGSYTLNPNGDGIGPNSTGGNYSLYPTPYTSTTITPAVGEVIQAVMGSTGYGQSGTPFYPPVASTSPSTSTDPEDNPNTPNNPQNPNNQPIVTGPDGTSGYYGEDGEFIPVNTGSNYGYPNATDTVNFGKGTSTADSSEESKPMSPVAKTFLWLILIIIIIAILRRLWNKAQGRL